MVQRLAQGHMSYDNRPYALTSQTEERPRSEAKEDHPLLHVCVLHVCTLKGAAHVHAAYTHNELLLPLNEGALLFVSSYA